MFVLRIIFGMQWFIIEEFKLNLSVTVVGDNDEVPNETYYTSNVFKNCICMIKNKYFFIYMVHMVLVIQL